MNAQDIKEEKELKQKQQRRYLRKCKVEEKILQKQLNRIFRKVAQGKTECWVDIPGFRKVKSKIIGFELDNIIWKPIKVRFLEKINRTDDTLEYNGEGCWCGEDCQGHWIKETIRYHDDFVQINQIEIIE